jgi:hypothetical protein
MTRDLGVWTAPDCALVLIDYQEEMFEVLPSIPSELDGIEPIDGSSMNALEDQAFRQAVEGDRAQAADCGRTSHGDLPHVRSRSGAEGRVRRAVRHRCCR